MDKVNRSESKKNSLCGCRSKPRPQFRVPPCNNVEFVDVRYQNDIITNKITTRINKPTCVTLVFVLFFVLEFSDGLERIIYIFNNNDILKLSRPVFCSFRYNVILEMWLNDRHL